MNWWQKWFHYVQELDEKGKFFGRRISGKGTRWFFTVENEKCLYRNATERKGALCGL